MLRSVGRGMEKCGGCGEASVINLELQQLTAEQERC